MVIIDKATNVDYDNIIKQQMLFRSIYYDIELRSFLTERTQGESLADYPKQRKMQGSVPVSRGHGKGSTKKMAVGGCWSSRLPERLSAGVITSTPKPCTESRSGRQQKSIERKMRPVATEVFYGS